MRFRKKAKHAVENYYAGTRSELRPFIPKSYQRVLEVGCGEGGFRANLAPEAEVWGVEMVPAVADIARGKLHRVLTGTFEQVAGELPDRYFDLVICNDVIEHMADDAAFLRAVCAKMSPSAHLIGSIPNMRNWPILRDLLFKKDWTYRDSGVLDRTHLRFYTVKTFPALLKACGYEVLRIEGINSNVKLRKRIFLQAFSLGSMADTRYLQFAFVARPKQPMNV
jgi:2-polyprenyl-3-methyl-5-hydroxy-6-metoxy-1,4-benzoquinol methylase